MDIVCVKKEKPLSSRFGRIKRRTKVRSWSPVSLSKQRNYSRHGSSSYDRFLPSFPSSCSSEIIALAERRARIRNRRMRRCFLRETRPLPATKKHQSTWSTSGDLSRLGISVWESPTIRRTTTFASIHLAGGSSERTSERAKSARWRETEPSDDSPRSFAMRLASVLIHARLRARQNAAICSWSLRRVTGAIFVAITRAPRCGASRENSWLRPMLSEIVIDRWVARPCAWKRRRRRIRYGLERMTDSGWINR